MSRYSVRITFTQDQVRMYNSQGFKLCVAFGVGSSPEFNVVAHADNISYNDSISWQERYFMAATKGGVSDGERFTMGTDAGNISFQQVYNLPANWSSYSVSNDKNIDRSSFKFVNQTSGDASAIVLMLVQGRPVPIYVSRNPVPGNGGTQLLTPTPKIALWLDRRMAETGTAYFGHPGEMSIIDMSGRTTADLTCDNGRFRD